MSCYSEGEIVNVVLEIIRHHPGIRTSSLIAAARERMSPNGEDLMILSSRNDDKFSQKVRNIKSNNNIAYLVWTTNEKNCQWFLR